MKPLLVTALAMVLTAPLTGCVALVASWPAVGDDTAINDPNVSPMPKVIAAGVRESLRRNPPPGNFILNLPEGLEQWRAQRIAAEISPSALIVTSDTPDYPVYHVTRVWVRGDRARVDVVRPLDAPRTWQRDTVHLRHGIDGWQPEYVKIWPLGMATPGSLYGWLDAGAIGDPPTYPESGASSTPPPPPAETPGTTATNTEDGIRHTIEVKEPE